MDNKEEALFELEKIMQELSLVLMNVTIIKHTTITYAFIYKWFASRAKKRIYNEPDASLYTQQFKRINQLMVILRRKDDKRVNTKVGKKRMPSDSGYKKVLTGINNQENLAILHKANPFVQLSMVM